jgi:hypothetical protein
MKNKYAFSYILLMAIVIMVSCKKNDPVTSDASFTGKWYLDSVQVQSSVGGQIIFTTVYRSITDYCDFREDGKRYRFVNNVHDTIAYSLTTASTGSLGVAYNQSATITDTIKLLTENAMILNSLQGGGSRLWFRK